MTFSPVAFKLDVSEVFNRKKGQKLLQLRASEDSMSRTEADRA